MLLFTLNIFNVSDVIAPGQARRQVLRFGEQYTFLGGPDCCFHHMFKTNSSGHNKLLGAQKSRGRVDPNTPY